MIRFLKALYNRVFRSAEIAAAMQELNIKPGETNVVFSHPGVTELAREIASFFDDAGGINFVEFRMFDASSMRRFEVTVRLASRPSPQQINAALREALEGIERSPESASRMARAALDRCGYPAQTLENK